MSLIRVIGPFPPPMHGFSAMTELLAQHLETNGIRVRRHDLSSKKTRRMLRHAVQASRAIKAGAAILAEQPAPVSLGCNGGLGLIYTAFITACARLRAVRITLHHHSYGYINTQSLLMSLICKLGGEKMTHVFLSQSMAHAFEQQYPTDQESEVIMNAAFVPTRQTKTLIQGAPLQIGLISNLNREKGLYDFLGVAKAMHDKGCKVKMHLAGPISSSEDLKQVQTAVAAGEVIWHGALYGKDKDAFFDSLDLFLFPTRYRMEAQPTVIYEAFAAGVPVIAFDRGTIADQVRDCISVVPQNADFAQIAAQKINEIALMPLADRQLLSDRARVRHLEDTESTHATLLRLFTAPKG